MIVTKGAARMRRSTKTWFVGGTALAVLLSSQPALAQAGGSTVQPDDIVVTARKRVERLQDVPISVQAISGLELERAGVENVEGLYGRVPGLYRSQNNIIGPQPDATYLVIRGVGASPAVEPSAGVFVDGVYQTAVGFDIGFLDLERVEVLRGPQGALFGRNTESGAINIVTRKPDERFGGRLFAQYDDFETIEMRGSLNLPLAGNLFMSIAGGYEKTDGFLHNITHDRPQDDGWALSGRLALRFIPSDMVEVNWTVDGAKRGGGIAGFGPRAILGKGYRVEDDYVRDRRVRNIGSALTIDVDLGDAQLTSITGVRKNLSRNGFDADGTDNVGNEQDINVRQWNVSEELRVSSPASEKTLKWLVGVYLFKQTDQYKIASRYGDLTGAIPPFDILYPGTVGSIYTDADRKGWSLFGQATYTLFDKLDLTVGARYSYEKFKQGGFNAIVIPAFGVNVSGPRANLSADDDQFAPMGSIAYRWSRDVMTYFTVSRGFKSGGFKRNPGLTAPNPVFAPEKALLYEAGLKASAFGGKLTTSLALYHIDLKDQQLSTIQVIDFLPVEVIDNVGKSRTRGFDFEIAAQPLAGFSLTGTIGYVDTKFLRYQDSSGNDRVGQEFPSVPNWTASITADYEHRLADDWKIGARASYRYIGKYFVGNGVVDTDPFFDIPSYRIVDLQASISKGPWTATVFAENLFDEYAVVNRFQGFFFPIDTHTFNTVLPPRKLGARLEYRF